MNPATMATIGTRIIGSKLKGAAPEEELPLLVADEPEPLPVFEIVIEPVNTIKC
jgi:hypothetical protein